MLADTRPEHVRLLTGPSRTTTVSGSLPPDAQHTHFRAQDAEHATHSALTVQPTLEDCLTQEQQDPHTSHTASVQQAAPCFSTRPPLEGPTPQLPQPRPHLRQLWFPHKNKSLPNPTTTGLSSQLSFQFRPSFWGRGRPAEKLCDKPQTRLSLSH